MGLALVVAGMPGTAEARVCGPRAGCVNSRDVRNNSLTSADVRNNSLTGADVADSSLTAADLNNEAGADFLSGEQDVPLTTEAAIVRSVTITAPTPGLVIVSASGFFQFQSANPDVGQCSIITGAALDETHLISAAESNAGRDSLFDVPFGATRGFDVAAGSTSFNLVCNETTGSNVTVLDTSLTAIFVPTRY